MLILVGVTVNLSINGGLFEKAGEAVEETKKAQYHEAITNIQMNEYIKAAVEKLTTKEYMDNIEEGLKQASNEKGILEGITVIRKNDEEIQIITKEGYVYKITEKEIEYIGKKDELIVPDLQESDIEALITPSKITNQDVTVEINTKITGYTLQYSLNGTNWENYTKEITMKENGIIYVRLINDFGKEGNHTTINIENIDKIEPNNFTPTATSTTNSITLQGSTTDVAKTDTNACSGIKAYYFSKDNGLTWEGGTSATSYTFTGLPQGTSYNLKMKAVDNAGNEVITETIPQQTKTVTALDSSNTTITYSPTGWTKGNVEITITTTVTGYTLQYSLNGTNWTNYTGKVPKAENGPIYARVIDSSGQAATSYATGNIENIDKVEPHNFTPTASSTSSSITIQGSTTDVAKTNTNGCSGIKAYYFSINNGASWVGGTSEASHTFTGLASGTSYNLKMKAVDSAGNEVITETVPKQTEMPKLSASQIKSTEYGKTVNYGVTYADASSYGQGKWEIFYADASHIYLITRGHLASTALSTTGYNGTSDFTTTNLTNKFPAVKQGLLNKTYDPASSGSKLKYPSSYTNMKATEYLLDSTKWTAYKNNTYADWAIGGPTYELFVKSYNAYYTNKANVELATPSGNGYNNPLSSSNSVPTGTHLNHSTSTFYWLACPGSDHNVMVCYMNGSASSVGFVTYNFDGHTLRPVVCLKSTVLLTWNSATNQYDLISQ